jgi:chemosensory pili system protein ChpA (sensor histidine kinase/response regulator)
MQDALMSESPLGDDLDEEIVEIFLEEADEVLSELRAHFPKWRDDPGNTDSLTIIRRSFHTLKGSGRMIGANQIGEFSWSIENLLNRVIDNSIAASPEVMDTIGSAIDVLPVMVGQLQGGPAPEVDIYRISAAAEALSSGKPVSAGEGAEKKIENLASAEAEDDSAQFDIVDESSLSVPLDSDELRQVYTDETKQHIAGLRAFLDQCNADMDGCYFEEPQIVILHTLHGGSATVGANELKQIFDILEPLAILYNEHRVKLDSGLLDLLQRVIQQTSMFLDDINHAGEKFALDVELVEELQLLFQQKKELFGAVTSAIDILKIIPEEDEVEAVSAGDEDETLNEISSSLEDLHDLMTTDVELSEVDIDASAEQEIEAQVPEEEAESFEDLYLDEEISEEFAGVEGEVDEEILDIFMEEAAELLVSIEQTLDDWQNDQDDHDLMIAIQRDIHTLKGGARMVNLRAIADISHSMETLLTAVVDGQVQVSDQMFSVLHLARDSLQDLYDGLKDGEYTAVADPQLLEQLDALRLNKSTEVVQSEPITEVITQPETTSEPPAPKAEYSDEFQDISGGFELLDIFKEEAGELLESIDQTLDDWLNDENNMDLVIKLQRDVHTLKGGARMVNLTGIGDLGHALETLLTAIVDGHVEISRPLFDGMHEVKDELQAMFEAVQEGRGDTAVKQHMLNLLDALRKGHEVPLEPIGGPDSTSEEATPSHMLPALDDSSSFDVTPSNAIPAFEDSTQVSLIADVAETTPSTPMDALDEEDSRLTRLVETAEKIEGKAPPSQQNKRTQPRVEQETIRVRSDLIDGLVNLAGETNIFRSRLEQQSNSFRFSLTELDQTVLRLQEQLKKLQAETDEQILSHYETNVDLAQHENFDPLEMDQYSTMQQLSRSLVESVGDLKSLQEMLGGLNRDSELLLLQQGRVNTELQDRLMQARVVPFAATMASRMRRITRQTCQQLGKQAELKIIGANEEMDRHVLDRMVAPLEHMLRNSIAHGIETPEVRRGKGKPEVGTITVTVSREGGEIVIQVADDGGGLDTASIRKKAEAKGLIIENADMTDDEVMQLVLTPGFSTAESVSQIAGRGVGMDVVNNEIRQLNGSLHIESVLGRGAAMTVRLPFTLSITQALLVRVGADLYAIPLTSIEGVSRIDRQEAERLVEQKEEQFQYGGDDYQVSSLGKLLGRQSGISAEVEESRPAIILVRAAGHRVGFYIDELLGHHEIVVKSLGAQVSSVSGMAGGTILGDGRVALILDVPALVRMVGAEHGLSETQQAQVMETPKSVKIRVMVVDDSITVRRVTTRLLERHEMEVITAKDGVDAVAKLEETLPDVMLLDVEMPRMDGYELASHMRNDERYRNVPIVMITSRTGAKHRERAEAIGVDRYLGKPYQEMELLENINQVLEERRPH